MAKIISDLEIVGRWGTMTCYLQDGTNLIKKSRNRNRPVMKKDQQGYHGYCLKEIQCLSEQWMRALRVLTQVTWPRGLESRVAGLLWHWFWIETSFRQVHLRLIQGMRLPQGKAALKDFCWSAYPQVDKVLRKAVFLNTKTWDTWLDYNVMEQGLAKAGLPIPTHLRIIYAEPNPEDGWILMYGFPRQKMTGKRTEKPVHLTPEKYNLTGGYLIALLEYSFEKPESDKPWLEKSTVPGGIVMVGYHIP
ncbi:MAG: hypothetical protein K9I85_05100 [Saprospiraceae bacterium]|nr:hypothetical protein [Saprospiraceae bacterium]